MEKWPRNTAFYHWLLMGEVEQGIGEAIATGCKVDDKPKFFETLGRRALYTYWVLILTLAGLGAALLHELINMVY